MSNKKIKKYILMTILLPLFMVLLTACADSGAKIFDENSIPQNFDAGSSEYNFSATKRIFEINNGLKPVEKPTGKVQSPPQNRQMMMP
jgi:hypothetical protein